MDSLDFSEETSKRFLFEAATGNLAAVKNLAQDPLVDINWKNDFGWNALHMACWNGHAEVVKFLLGLGGLDPNLQSRVGKTPFSVACSGGSVQVVSLMLADERVDINQPDKDRETPFFRCIVWDRYPVVELFLASRRPIDTKIVPPNWSGYATLVQATRKMGNGLISDLLERYEKNPAKVTNALRKKLGYQDEDIGNLFALVIYFNDGYLQPRKDIGADFPLRFFSVASRLPIEIQMLLCHRVYGSPETIVKAKHSEPAFKEYAKA